MRSPDTPSPPYPAATILLLSLSATVGLGIGRFAYSLVLPDMRDSLGWSYSAAGFMNTVNAAGYLLGALVTARLSRRFGLYPLLRAGTLACLVSLVACGLTANFALLSIARLVAGIGAALSFVTGCGQAFGGPAYQSMIPSLVPRRDLPNAIALNSTQFNLSRVLGPGVGAAVLATIGTAWCFAVNGVSFFFVIVALSLLRLPPHVPATSRPALAGRGPGPAWFPSLSAKPGPERGPA